MKKFFLLLVTSFILFSLADKLSAGEVFIRNILLNGKFKKELAFWQCENCGSENISYDKKRKENYFQLGRRSQTVSLWQTVDLAEEAGRARLIFYYKFITADTKKNDHFTFFVRNHKTHKIYKQAFFYPSDGQMYGTINYSLTAFKGKKVDVVFSVKNNSKNLTKVKLYDIKVREKSFSKLEGTVVDSDGHLIKKAKVTIKRRNGEKLWSGETNSKGIFIAKNFKGSVLFKVKIIVKKDNREQTFRRYLRWGKAYNKIFVFTE